MHRILLLLFTALMPSLIFSADIPGWQSLAVASDYPTELLFSFRVIIASLLGILVGISNRQKYHIGALIYCAICSGSCLFTVVMIHGFIILNNSYIMSGVTGLITGVGFIGASLIFRDKQRIYGTISAATMWATVAIGMATGFGMYIIAPVTTAIIALLNYFARDSAEDV
jgi:putative Mg2+ transporter-C (MgtC) family protein